MFNALTATEAAQLQGFLGRAARQATSRQGFIDRRLEVTRNTADRASLICRYEQYREMILEFRALNLDIMNRAS